MKKWWKKQHETWWNMGEITIKNRVFIYVTITNSVHLADVARFCVPHPGTLKLPNHTSSPSLIGYTCTGYIWIRYTSRICSMIAGKPPTWVPNSSSVMFPSYTQPSKLMFASPSHQMLDNVNQYQRITSQFLGDANCWKTNMYVLSHFDLTTMKAITIWKATLNVV